MRSDYEKKFMEMRNRYEGLIHEITGSRSNDVNSNQLTQLKDQNTLLEQENKKLKNQINFYEWKSNNIPNAPKNECSKCQNLLITNGRLLGKLKNMTTSGINKGKTTRNHTKLSISKDRRTYIIEDGDKDASIGNRDILKDKFAKRISEGRLKSKGVLNFNSNGDLQSLRIRKENSKLVTEKEKSYRDLALQKSTGYQSIDETKST